MFILLDIDGVMVKAASWKQPEMLNDGFPAFSNVAISSLQKILSDTGASIVLTTSHKSLYSLDEWKSIFSKRGIVAEIDKLNENVNGYNRKDEIVNWLNVHPDLDDFVIIDDDKSLNDLSDYYKNQLILTSPMIGLNDKAACEAVDILMNRKMERV